MTSLTENLDDVQPDDIYLLRQFNLVTEHSGPQDPIIVNITAKIFGNSGKVRITLKANLLHVLYCRKTMIMILSS